MTGQREQKLEYVADATGLYRVEPDQATGSDLLIRIDYPPGPAKALRVVVPMMPGYDSRDRWQPHPTDDWDR